jgi:multidrug efflux pump subunit AcrA (membrane-fusion protein)
MYGQVKFTLHRLTPPPIIPTAAMLFAPEGTRVAVVDGDGDRGRIGYKLIEVGRDYGPNLEVRSGLFGNERVVTNPGQRLAADMEVEIANPDHPGKLTPAETARIK